jgi:hypothetical protein
MSWLLLSSHVFELTKGSLNRWHFVAGF